MEKDIIVILKGRLAKLIVQVVPNLYKKFISVNRRGVAILYVKCSRQSMGFLGVPYYSTRSL